MNARQGDFPEVGRQAAVTALQTVQSKVPAVLMGGGQVHRMAHLVRSKVQLHWVVAVVMGQQIAGGRVHNGGHGVEQPHEANLYRLRPEDTVLSQHLGQQTILPLVYLVRSVAGRSCSTTKAEQIKGQTIDGLPLGKSLSCLY